MGSPARCHCDVASVKRRWRASRSRDPFEFALRRAGRRLASVAVQPLPPPLPVPEKNWWDRNWKWVTALLLALTVAFSVGMVGLLQGFLRGSPAYQEALARARRSPAVVAALGTPIESGLFVMGKVQTTGVKTTSDLAGRLHGPKGEAALVVSGTHSVGGLQLHVFVQIDKSGERIDLSDSPASK